MKNYQDNIALRNLSALVDFSNLINSSLDLDFTLNNLILTCFGKFHTTKGLIALFNDDDTLEVKICKGFNESIVNSINQLRKESFVNNQIEILEKDNTIGIFKEIRSSNGLKGIICLGHRMSKLPYDEDDESFLGTIVNIAATSIENSQIVAELKDVNRSLDNKVNQLSSLFDISKEFSGLLEVNMITKLVVFSVIGQMMVSKYALVTCEEDKIEILDTKFNKDELVEKINLKEIKSTERSIRSHELENSFPGLFNLGIRLIVPMQMKGENRGFIVLGNRITGAGYSESDIEYLYSVGSLAIISIENANLFKEAIEKERIEKDLELAKKIQNNLLPKKQPAFKNLEIAAVNETARQVGGDYYDLVKLDENRLLFAIGDVSGKGVQAALIMANVQAFLKSITKQNLPLDESTNLMNDLVSENTSGGGFITFFWGIINNENKELTYVNAGHNPPLLIRDGKIEKLKTGGMILGVMETMIPYKKETVKLKENDLLVLFTDGITEAMNTKQEEFSDERLENLCLNKSDVDPDEILEMILEEVKIFTKGAEQSDDITSLILKIR